MKIVVRDSNIEGKGVFATQDIKKGEVVMEWDTSNQLSQEEIKELPKEEQEYVTYAEGKFILMQPPERYINHSCEANTTTNNFADIALRDIKKGEEITANYSEDLPPGFKMKCSCSSKKCRGVIISNKKKNEN